MNRSNWMLTSGLMVGMAGVSGCLQREQSAGVQDEVLPADLETMQGSWLAESSDLCMCTAMFSGYTLRLRYQQASGEALMKRNISIKSVDMKSKLLLLYNTAGAWNYNLSKVADKEFLELEFYSAACHSWFPVKMRRA